MHDTLVFTVSHPGTDSFYSEFLSGLLRQKDKSFDFLVIEETHQDFDMLNAVYLSSSGTPAGNRAQAICYALEKGYKTLISLDGDDRYDPCKIAFLKGARKEGTLLAHDMRLINDVGHVEAPFFIGNRIPDGGTIGARDIMHYNIFGFSNTAFDVPSLAACLPIPHDILAIDWWVSMCALLNGTHAVYRNVVLSDYRLHHGNMATVKRNGMNALSRELTVKRLHYEALLARLPKQHPLYDALSQALEDVLNFNPGGSFLHDETKDTLLWWENSYRQIKKTKEGCVLHGLSSNA